MASSSSPYAKDRADAWRIGEELRDHLTQAAEVIGHKEEDPMRWTPWPIRSGPEDLDPDQKPLVSRPHRTPSVWTRRVERRDRSRESQDLLVPIEIDPPQRQTGRSPGAYPRWPTRLMKTANQSNLSGWSCSQVSNFSRNELLGLPFKGEGERAIGRSPPSISAWYRSHRPTGQASLVWSGA